MEEERSFRVSSPERTIGGRGVTGTIDLRHRDPSSAVDLTDRVHLLPCSIKHDGPCPVSQYFKPKKTDVVVDGSSVEEAFFRGRKLEGITVPLPEGYRGYVLENKKSGKGKGLEPSEGEGEFSRWVSRAEFRNLTYWNHDIVPSSDDPLVRSFHWFSVADAESNDLVIKPQALDIIWGKDGRYWRLPANNDQPVELLQVCWLEVTCSYRIGGYPQLMPLSKGRHTVTFEVSMKPDAFGWSDSPIYLMTKVKGKYTWKKADLSKLESNKCIRIPQGSDLTFDIDGTDTEDDKVSFGLYEIWSGRWKGGLLIHRIIIN